MNRKSIVVTGLVVFAAMFGLGYLIHDMLLADIYKQTASVWRPAAEMKNFMPYMLAADFIFAMVFAALFARVYEKNRAALGQGLRYGLWIGFLMAPASALMWYAILPIPGILAVYWAAGCFTEKIVLGLIASLVYKPA